MNKLFSVSFLTIVLASAMICVAQKDISYAEVEQESSYALWGCPGVYEDWMRVIKSARANGKNMRETVNNSRMFELERKCKVQRAAFLESKRRELQNAVSAASTPADKEAAKQKLVEFENGILESKELAHFAFNNLGIDHSIKQKK